MKMAFCMNMYARLDPRVAPFLFLLRTWGRQRRIVMKPDSASYDGLTPFMLICIGLFYLMRVNPGVLPPMRTLLNKRPSELWWLQTCRSFLFYACRFDYNYVLSWIRCHFD